jgi:hypothetical protein
MSRLAVAALIALTACEREERYHDCVNITKGVQGCERVDYCRAVVETWKGGELVRTIVNDRWLLWDSDNDGERDNGAECVTWKCTEEVTVILLEACDNYAWQELLPLE